MQKKIILDTFTLQEIEKDMRMYVWVEVNRYHRKPEKKKNETASNYIYTSLYIYILMKQINTTTTTIIIMGMHARE